MSSESAASTAFRVGGGAGTRADRAPAASYTAMSVSCSAKIRLGPVASAHTFSLGPVAPQLRSPLGTRSPCCATP